MKTTVKEISPTRKQIDIEIDAEVVRAAYDQISDRYAKAANVPGFRPGHAPRAVVRTRFKAQIRSEVLREIIPDSVQEAIEEHKLEPLGEPELDFDNVEGLDQPGQKPLSFQVNVEILADINLGEYKGVEVTRRTRPARDEDIDRVIEQLREGSASLEPVEDRGAQLGDTVTASFYGKFLNDPNAEPINVEEVDVVLGDEGVVPEINENLTGAKPEDEKSFAVNYPPNFSSKGLAGKQVEYKVRVSAVRIKELPDLDDEWAQSLGDEEKIEVNDQEIEDEINAMADASRQSPEQVRAVLTKQGGERSIAPRLRNRKALDFLVANASVTDEEWKEEEE